MPKPILLPYQRALFDGVNSHKFSLWLSSRQIGKSFSVSLWAVMRCLENKNHKVICLSSSESQSRELMEKALSHAQFMGSMATQWHETFFEDTKNKQLEIRFANGSKIIGLPANPRTARGYSGDIILDEFAFHADNKRIWQAMYPSITSGFNSAGGYKLIVVSTAQGKNDMFYLLATKAETDSKWYYQRTTIFDAVADGYPANIEELKAGILDDDIWQMEYMCEFMDSADALLPYELIAQCESSELHLVDDISTLTGDLFGGNDIGRRKDLTVPSILERLGDTLYLRKLDVLKNMKFSNQFKIINGLAYYCRRLAIDETGIGMQLAEDLETAWGEMKVIKMTFTSKSKEEMASRLKNRFTDKSIRIPVITELREDLHSVRKITTPAGNIVLSADRTDLGHADRFWSLALGVHAAALPVGMPYIPPAFGTQNLSGGSRYGLKKLA